jgi:hypothetical protein
VGEPQKSFRYETAVATLVGVLALVVSAYTAHVQRQQVRAQVWPALEYWTSNSPEISLAVGNKGVGPALVKHVLVTVDGAPVQTWEQALKKLLGPGDWSYSQSTIGARVVSPGETIPILTPQGPDGALHPAKEGLGARMNAARFRVGVEICFCSTLEECWTLIKRPNEVMRTEPAKKCPPQSASSFLQ